MPGRLLSESVSLSQEGDTWDVADPGWSAELLLIAPAPELTATALPGCTAGVCVSEECMCMSQNMLLLSAVARTAVLSCGTIVWVFEWRSWACAETGVDGTGAEIAFADMPDAGGTAICMIARLRSVAAATAS